MDMEQSLMSKWGMLMMEIFVINLDRNVERMLRLSRQLERFGVSCRRFSAVDGKRLTSQEKRKLVNRFRWWCTKGYAIRDGEIGCTASHNEIYSIIEKEKIPYCCILEDDAVLADRFVEQLDRVERFVSTRGNEPIIVQLTNYNNLLSEDGTVVPIKFSSHSEGYVINYAAAIRYRQANDPICTPVDFWEYWRKKGVYNLYQVFPAVCAQDWSPGFVSDVCPSGSFSYNQLSLVGKFFWRIKRIIGVCIDRILF